MTKQHQTRGSRPGAAVRCGCRLSIGGLLVAAGVSTAAAQFGEMPIAFKLSRSYALPPAHWLGFTFHASTDAIVAWHSRGHEIAYISRGSLVLVPTGVLEPLHAAFVDSIDPYAVELLDGETLTIRSLDLLTGIENVIDRLDPDWIVTAAVRARSRWVVAAIGIDNVHRLYTRSKHGWTPGAELPKAVHLSSFGDNIVVTNMHHPFDVAVMDEGGRMMVTLNPVEWSTAAAQWRGTDSMALASRVHSLKSVAMADTVILQTLSDLRSDTRVFVRYDISTGRRTYREAIAPIGFGDFRHGRLGALLGLTPPSILVYRRQRD